MVERFLDAQKEYFNIALKELENGKKESHWMWFIFPQIKGLGKSEKAKYYEIKSLSELSCYIENQILMDNYKKLCRVLLKSHIYDAKQIFGEIDTLKLHSSITLFYLATKHRVFEKILNKFFNGKTDFNTSMIYRKMEIEEMKKEQVRSLTFDDLIFTEEQLNVLNKYDLLKEIKYAIDSEALIAVDVFDFQSILNNREIIGFVNHTGAGDFEIHKFKDVEKSFAIVYMEGIITLFETNKVIERIRNEFGRDVAIIYSLGNGNEFKVFALFTA